MRFTDELSGVLALLSEVLDGPERNISDTVERLVTDAQAAVPHFAGVTVVVGPGDELRFTVLADGFHADQVLSSVKIPMPGATVGAISNSDTYVVLYATQPGAFVDIAADLTWLTGRPYEHYELDRHLTLAAAPDRVQSVHTARTINQAIGVLIAHGFTPEAAQLELRARSVSAGVGVHTVASRILLDPRFGSSGLPGA